MNEVLGVLAPAQHGHDFHVLYEGPTPPDAAAQLPLQGVPDPISPTDSPLDRVAHRLRLDLVWFLAPKCPRVELPFIATVWDLEHRNQPYFPEVNSIGWTWDERESYYRATLPRAACVVVGTAEGKQQIERFYAVPASLIEVVPFPTPSFSEEELRDDPGFLKRLGLDRPYLFYPAQLWPHKNHSTILYALKQLRETGDDLELVLTGADTGNRQYLQALVLDLGIEDRVRFLGFVDRRTVVMLYRYAFALVYPSLFGPDNLPPLEAFALGCPVIAADLHGTSEIVGDAAIRLEATDDAAWADAVRDLLQHPELRTDLAERGLVRSRRWTAHDYVRVIVARLDALAPILRCWSRNA